VTHILGDGQFKKHDASKVVAGGMLNIVMRNEHVPEVELNIRTIKEQTFSMYNRLPFKRF